MKRDRSAGTLAMLCVQEKSPLIGGDFLKRTPENEGSTIRIDRYGSGTKYCLRMRSWTAEDRENSIKVCANPVGGIFETSVSERDSGKVPFCTVSNVAGM